MSHRNPNPQGKGLTPVLEGLDQARPGVPLPPKPIDQVSHELFTSLFVLNSEFRFRPRVGKSYWLYRVDGRFKLLMLAPGQWSAGPPGQFIGECVLREDITWTLVLDEKASRDPGLLDWIQAERRRLEETLDSAQTLEEALPDYVAAMPFYNRLLAHGLSSSLRVSLGAAGLLGLTYAEARRLLPGQEQTP